MAVVIQRPVIPAGSHLIIHMNMRHTIQESPQEAFSSSCFLIQT